jgi:hypothetical protein
MFGKTRVEEAAVKAIERLDGAESSGEEGADSVSNDGKSIMGSALPKDGLPAEDVFGAIKVIYF